MKRLQKKLTWLLLLTSTLPLLAVSVITLLFLHRISKNEEWGRIENDLNIVDSLYHDTQINLKYTIRDQNRKIYSLLERGEIDFLRDELRRYIQKNNLDFFVVTDNELKIIISLPDSSAEGEYLTEDQCLARAARGEVVVSTDILSSAQLKKLGVLEKAKVPGNDTMQALAIKAELPVLTREEKVIATMSGGYLLNNNRPFVGKISKTIGLDASIYMGDLCVASNRMTAEGELLGARIKSDVAKKAIAEGKRHIGPMMRPKEHCFCGFAPIFDNEHNVIGSIRMCFPESYLFSLRNDLIRLFCVAVLLSLILAFLFGFIKGGGIVKSIEKLRLGTEAISKGDFTHKIEIKAKDEVADLAAFFNKMSDELGACREEMEEGSRKLEDKVKERTGELELAHKKLVEYEKMAAMGRMASTLGHELRNVFAGLRTVIYNLKSRIVEEAPGLIDSVKDLEYEISYGNDILNNVLRFSLPKKLVLSDMDINSAIDKAVSSFNLEEVFKNIKVTKNLNPGAPAIKADIVQVREVISNLVMNAVQAMPDGGKLGISTMVAQGEGIEFAISDTGAGISEKAKENLFVPFFTTKSRGLGLGLYISKEIVEAHKGKIELRTEPGKGTTFIVTLPGQTET